MQSVVTANCLYCSNCQYYESTLPIFVWWNLTRYMSTLSGHLMMSGTRQYLKCLVVSSPFTHLTCSLRPSSRMNSLNRTTSEVSFYMLLFAFSFLFSIACCLLLFFVLLFSKTNILYVMAQIWLLIITQRNKNVAPENSFKTTASCTIFHMWLCQKKNKKRMTKTVTFLRHTV